MARIPVTVTLPEELVELIDAKAKEAGKNRSQMIEEIAQKSISGKADEEGFYESIQLRGQTETMKGLLRGLLSDEGGHTFSPDRYWLVKFMVKVNPGETPFGGMKLLEPEPPAPRKKR